VAIVAMDSKAVEIAPDGVEEALTGFGQGELAGAALKQADAKIALQGRDVAADRRRGQRQPPGRRRKAAGFRAADKGFQVGEGFHGHFQVMLESNSTNYRLITHQ
jgi:hypothetical protein